MRLEDLNNEQRKAAETLEGPVLILAGAGSGKTRALTYRIANLLDHGVAPWNILAITFTNKAAREMQERVAQLAGEKGHDVWISTFHSMCARILRRDIEKLGYQRSFTIYDDDDTSNLLKDIYKQHNLDDKLFPIKEIKAKISDAKNRLMDPDEWFASSPRDYRSQQIHDIYSAYELRLRQSNSLDFDDLLVRTLELLTDHPPVLEAYRDRFRYVHVDEYQDTNFAQYSLVKILTQRSRNLCVVGDDDQSIYGWRGADIRNILDFQKDFPEATVIKLEQNYRSTSNILDAANQVIAHNTGRMEKALWTEKPEGEQIHVFQAGDEREEAAWICDRLRRLHDAGQEWGDFALLYRSNAQSRVLEDMLVRAAVPYRIYGGQKFYDRKEVKDILAYLRCLVNPTDAVSLKRIINTPRRSIGDSTVQELVRYADENGIPLYSTLADIPETLSTRPRKSVAQFGELMNDLMMNCEDMKLTEIVAYVIEQTGLKAQYEHDTSDESKNRLENIAEFIGAVTEFEAAAEDATLQSYLENVSLVSDLDNAEFADKAVTLMTMHSAKGLEFPTVFLTGIEENIFPSARSIQEEDRLEEERRLCYVAITRAQKVLHISYARQRSLFNQISYNAPSRFLSEIPPRLMDNGAVRKRETAYSASSGSGYQQRGYPQKNIMPGRKGIGLGSGTKSAASGGISAGLGAGKSALGIPGVQKGFTPSAAASIPSEAVSLYEIGDRVLHKKFGGGTVADIHGRGRDARIVIMFAAYGQKEFSLMEAPIVKVNE